jgi:hypothetical protein
VPLHVLREVKDGWRNEVERAGRPWEAGQVAQVRTGYIGGTPGVKRRKEWL